MQNLAVFYHLYLSKNDSELFLWPLWVDEQLGAIRDSGLSDHAQINVCVTLPANFHHPFINRNYYDIVHEYITTRYPFAVIANVYPSYEPPIYEGQTLTYMYQHALENTGAVLYLHSKGITRTYNPNIHDWRRYLQYFMIELWRDCIPHLETHDMVTVRSNSLSNFWWASTDFIKSLPHPLYTDKYLPNEPHFWPGARDFRYSFEIWTERANPRKYYMHDSGDIEFYRDFYPPSAYRK